jgi:hypothetical protein
VLEFLGQTVDTGPVAEAAQQWLGGYRSTGRRRLEDAEASGLIARLRGELRPLRRANRVTRWSASVIVLAIASYFFFRPDPNPAMTVFAALGVMILVLGPLGALLEIVFAPGRGSRVFFILAVLLAVLGYWLEPLAVAAGIVVIMGGLTMLLSRLLGRPRRIAALGAAIVDVHRGEVLVFESAEPAGEESWEEAFFHKRIEILPLSRVVYRLDGAISPTMEIAPVVSTAAPPADPDGGAPVRELSASEREELARAQPRLRWRSTSEVLQLTWLLALILRAITNVLRGHLDPRLGSVGWMLTLAGAAYLTLSRVRWHRRLAADVRAGRVERRPVPGSAAASEVLPASGQQWSTDGFPAPWRIGSWE